MITQTRWRIAQLILLVVLLSGAALMLALANGAANPPRAPHLAADYRDAAALIPHNAPLLQNAQAWRLPDRFAHPFTLEARAGFAGATAWGVWAQFGDAPPYHVLVRPDGYISTAYGAANWREFIHARAGANTLTIHVDAYGITARVNDEIAARLALPDVTDAQTGVIAAGDAPTWAFIRVYTDAP